MPAGIHQLAVPTPFLVGAINCYLIEDDPLTLVDAGPNSGSSLVALEALLAEHGRRIEDLERLVLTHQHPDHVGLAHILADRSGAEVCSFAPLAPWLEDFDARMEDDDRFAEELMLRHGVPDDVVTALRSVARLARAFGEDVHVARGLGEGDEIAFAGRSFTVHHRPGHSPSDIVLHDAQARVLIAGDHLIKHISSNPLVSKPLEDGAPPGRPHALTTYMASLRATQAMDVEVVLAGHGEPVTDHRGLVDERMAATERRAQKIAGLLGDEPRSVHEIATSMWGKVAITQAFLTLSEVLGHLDLLVARGEAVELDEGERTRFAAVA